MPGANDTGSAVLSSLFAAPGLVATPALSVAPEPKRVIGVVEPTTLLATNAAAAPEAGLDS